MDSQIPDRQKPASDKIHSGLLLASLVMLAALLGVVPGHPIGGASAASAISVEIGKAKLLRLSLVPDVIVLGNPAVADIVVEANGQLILLGREPGETNLLILDKKGKTILSKAIVVGPVKQRRVTVDRGPESFTLSCNPRCVPVATPQGSGATTAAAPAAAPAEQGSETAAADAGGTAAADIASALNELLGGQSAEQ